MQENKKGLKISKKVIKAILLKILVPIMIIVLLAGFFIAVVEGIIEIVKTIVESIINFILHPIDTITQFLRVAGNRISSWLDLKSYSSTSKGTSLKTSEKIRILLSDETVKEIKEAIEAQAIDTEMMGLTNNRLKEMILASYASMTTVDTQVAIQVSELEYSLDWAGGLIGLHNDNIEYFEIEDEEGNKSYYMGTTGIIKIVENVDDEEKELMCYSQQTYDEILEDLKSAVEGGKTDQINTISEILRHSYTVDTIGEIKIYNPKMGYISKESLTYTTQAGEEILLSGVNKDFALNNLFIPSYTGQYNMQNLSYTEEVSGYVTPMQFLVDLLMLSASGDYIDQLCQLIHEGEIKLQLFENSTETVTTNIKEYDIKGNIALDGKYSTEEKETISLPNKKQEATTSNNLFYLPDLINSTSEQNTTQTVTKRKDVLFNSEQSDEGKCISITKQKEFTSSYTLKKAYVDVWMCKLTNQNKISSSSTYETVNEQGNQQVILDRDEDNNKIDIDINSENIPEVTVQGEQFSGDTEAIKNYIINKDNATTTKIEKKEGEAEVQKVTGDYSIQGVINEITLNNGEYNITNEQYDTTGARSKTLIYSKTTYVESTVGQATDNTDIFLGLWKNKDGKKEVGQKFDKNGKKVKYVDLYNGENYPGDLIVNADIELFNLLEMTEDTEGLSDLMKYILYRYSGKDYGVTSFDFSNYQNSFNGASGYIYGNSVQEKVWFALKDLGYTDEAVAGAMGNIHYESLTFNPQQIELGYNEYNGGIGLCQWTNNSRGSTGRNTQLKQFAASRRS